MSASEKLFEIADRPGASEHSIQTAYFAWTRLHVVATGDQRLTWIHAIPNGGDRQLEVAALLKAEGVRSGVADVCFPFWSGRHPFGYLEFKTPKRRKEKDGGLSENQVKFRDHVLGQGGFFATVYTWAEGRDETLKYLASTR